MTRVSENSTTASVKFALNKAKEKLEDLQLRGSTLKNIRRPSDNPLGSTQTLEISSVTGDNDQYIRNANYALTQLNITEKSLAQLTEILMKAKEIAIAQASDIYNPEVRKNVSNEVEQLRNQALSIANKRLGNRYIFAGHSTLTAPFNVAGEYFGDTGKINLEVSKDFFVPVNLNGEEVFFAENDVSAQEPVKLFPHLDDQPEIDRGPASVEQVAGFQKRSNLFAQLTTLKNALENNDSTLIQNILVDFDDSVSRLITMRTRVGSISKSIQDAQQALESENIDHAERKSKLVDADLAELFSDLAKQQQVLKTTYQAGNSMMNKNLLDFLR